MQSDHDDDPAHVSSDAVPDGLHRPGSDPTETDSGAAPTFAPAVARRHRWFDADAYDEIYVVGDVHGCLAELRALWDRLSPGDDDLVVFVGDLVRKGPESVAAVEFVAERPNAVSVLGNNEAKVLRGDVDPEPFEPVRESIASFPLAVSWDDALAVHGGLRPDRALDDLDADDLLEARTVPPGNGYDGPFWFERYDGPPRVFFGHTVLREPLVRESAVGLDTGCVYGGSLTAYDYRCDELLDVPARRTYQERPDEKFLEPAAIGGE